jgi:RNA polymerase sigma-70 factor (ECF subfamily)
MRPPDDDDDLIARASQGDADARGELLARHRARLKRMVACRLDRRLAARLDPSDVVQDVLAEAHRQMPEFLQERPIPFYPWLRQIAWERLVDLHRRHVLAQRRSVGREARDGPALPDESAARLVDCLLASQTSPSAQARRAELRDRMRQALLRLGERDREVLVLRYLEQLTTAEVAAVLGIREGAVKLRQLRALERLRTLAEGELGEVGP